MVERQREPGVLKAVSDSSRAVPSVVLRENGVLGLLAGIVGMAAVADAIRLTNALQPQARLSLDPLYVLLLLAHAVSAVLTAWPPSHRRPVAVLRNE